MEEPLWRILLVDDDEDDFVYTRALLSDSLNGKFRLDWASTYESGLQGFQHDCYEVYLVDYRLGEHDGLELVKQGLAGGCQAPIILMTGQGSYAVDIEAMQAGATDYLQKTELSAPLLERTIRYAIQSKQAEALLKERSEQLAQANQALRLARDELEQRVLERTSELAEANRQLRAEILERRKAEEALRTSETRFRTLAESTSSAIFILEGSQIRYANPAVRGITGFEPHELVNRDFWVIAHPTYQELLKKSGLENPVPVPEAGQPAGGSPIQIPTRYEIKLRTKRGEERWLDVSMGFMVLDGQPYRVVTAFDITERDLAEQALRKAKYELEERVAIRSAELLAQTDALRQANERLQHELERRAELIRLLEQAQR